MGKTITEIMGNETVKKVGRALQKIQNDKNVNMKYHQLYIDIKSNIPNGRTDKMLSFISKLSDVYSNEYSRYVLTENELNELIGIIAESTENVRLVKDAVMLFSVTGFSVV